MRRGLLSALALAAMTLVLMTGGPQHARAAPSEGLTLHVDPQRGSDSRDGSVATPLKTIKKALTMAGPGSQVLLASGVYSEQVVSVTAGLPGLPIVLQPEPGASPIIDGREGKLNGPHFSHSFMTMRGIEVRNVREGVRVEGATGVTLENNHIHDVQGECVRLRFSAQGNRVAGNRIHDCGLSVKTFPGNAEGIYIGTAPEQRAKNGGKPDPSRYNEIVENEIYDVGEGIDIKEDSSQNNVRGNVVYQSKDPNSGGYSIRSDGNYLTDNLSRDNKGAGFRFGGDVTLSPEYGEAYHYGVDNVLRGNRAEDNKGQAYKLINTQQDIDGSNTARGNGSNSIGGAEPCNGPCEPLISPSSAPVSVHRDWDLLGPAFLLLLAVAGVGGLFVRQRGQRQGR